MFGLRSGISRGPQGGGALCLAATLAALTGQPPAAQCEAGKCKLAGKAVDVATGKPAAGIPFMVYVRKPAPQRPVATLVTPKADGTFETTVERNVPVMLYWRQMPTAKHLLDMAWLRASDNYMVRLEPLTGDKTDLVLKTKVRPSVELTGRVVDEKQRPVTGASVYFTRYLAPAKTDAAGAFVLRAAPADRDYELLALSEDMKRAKVVKLAAGTKHTTIALSPTREVNGRAVTEEGKAAADLQFRLYPTVNDEQLYLRGMTTTFTADGQGAFTATGLIDGGTYKASWYGNTRVNERFRDGDQTLTVKPGQTVALNVKRFLDDWDAPGNIGISEDTRSKHLANFCLDGNDNILACDGARNAIRVISPHDTPVDLWKLNFSPRAIECRADGHVLVGGVGQLAILDSFGKVLKQAALPGAPTPKPTPKPAVRTTAARAATAVAQRLLTAVARPATAVTRAAAPAVEATGVGWTGNDVFVALRHGTGYSIFRYDADLKHPTMIVKGLRGCCGQMDFTAKDGALYVAVNTQFKVAKYDRDGNELAALGRKKAGDNEGFGGCCEPKNVCFDSAGNLYTSESTECCVKRWTPDGKLLGTVGTVNGIRGCVRVTIGVNKDRTQLYMLDTARNLIRRLTLES